MNVLLKTLVAVQLNFVCKNLSKYTNSHYKMPKFSIQSKYFGLGIGHSRVAVNLIL